MAKEFTSDAPSLAEIRRRKKPKQESTWIVLDPDISNQITEIENKLERARAREAKGAKGANTKSLADGSEVTALEKELEKLEEKAGDYLAEFVFQDPGMKKYDDLVTDCPPTKEQKDQWKEHGGEGVLSYNPDDFVPRLISLCAVKPKVTEEEAYELVEEWGTGDISKLFQTAQSVCLIGASVPLSRRSRTGTEETPSSD